MRAVRADVPLEMQAAPDTLAGDTAAAGMQLPDATEVVEAPESATDGAGAVALNGHEHPVVSSARDSRVLCGSWEAFARHLATIPARA